MDAEYSSVRTASLPLQTFDMCATRACRRVRSAVSCCLTSVSITHPPFCPTVRTVHWDTAPPVRRRPSSSRSDSRPTQRPQRHLNPTLAEAHRGTSRIDAHRCHMSVLKAPCDCQHTLCSLRQTQTTQTKTTTLCRSHLASVHRSLPHSTSSATHSYHSRLRPTRSQLTPHASHLSGSTSLTSLSLARLSPILRSHPSLAACVGASRHACGRRVVGVVRAKCVR